MKTEGGWNNRSSNLNLNSSSGFQARKNPKCIVFLSAILASWWLHDTVTRLIARVKIFRLWWQRALVWREQTPKSCLIIALTKSFGEVAKAFSKALNHKHKKVSYLNFTFRHTKIFLSETDSFLSVLVKQSG